MQDVPGIREPVLRELVGASGNGIAATIAGRRPGFALVVHLGDSNKILTTSRGAVRLFASLDTAGAFVKDIGIERFEVDMSDHQPGRLRGARPDRALALRRARTRLRQQELELRP